jgi:hypothetical protein
LCYLRSSGEDESDEDEFIADEPAIETIPEQAGVDPISWDF